jgi:hypothetical protein
MEFPKSKWNVPLRLGIFHFDLEKLRRDGFHQLEMEFPSGNTKSSWFLPTEVGFSRSKWDARRGSGMRKKEEEEEVGEVGLVCVAGGGGTGWNTYGWP